MTETAEPVLGGLSLAQLDQLLDQVCGVEQRRPARRCHRYARTFGLTVPVPVLSPRRPRRAYKYWADSWFDAKRIEVACEDAPNERGRGCTIHQARSQGNTIISGSPGWIERAHDAAMTAAERSDDGRHGIIAGSSGQAIALLQA